MHLVFRTARQIPLRSQPRGSAHGTGALVAVLAFGVGLAACGGSTGSGSNSTGSSSNGNVGSSGSGSGVSSGSSNATSSGATSSQSGAGLDDAGGPTTDATSTVTTSPGMCPTPTVQIDFSPMYSAFVPGSTTHTFQIPAVTDDGNSATWSLSDSTQAQLVPQTFGDLPGVMITVEGVGTGTTGEVTVYATESDGSCGASVLTITSATENDWQIGNARYNDGVSLSLARPDGGGGGGVGAGPRTADGGSFFERDGGTACTNCHGVTATTGPFRNVSHTPEQTGGFSDTDLIQIITKGEIPDGGYFDPTVINTACDGGAACTQAALNEWHSFHQWADITSDQYPGIVVYLRSLQPEQQNGSPAANFGGVGRGRRDGGAFRRDGGPGFRDASTD
jgi:hypothetical protein